MPDTINSNPTCPCGDTCAFDRPILDQMLGAVHGWEQAAHWVLELAGKTFCEGKDSGAAHLRDLAGRMEEQARSTRTEWSLHYNARKRGDDGNAS